MIALTSCGDRLGELPPNQSSNALNADFFFTYKAYIYSKNPYVNGDRTETSPNMQRYLDTVAQITEGSDFLTEKCNLALPAGASYQSTYDCMRVLNDRSPATVPIQSNDGSWNFEPNSDPFYQVNAYYHAKNILNRFLNAIGMTYQYVHYEGPLTVPPATNFYLPNTKSFWFNNDLVETENNTITIYSKCFVDNMNAFYDPGRNFLCLGFNNDRPGFRMAQDPSIIYHEMGHVLVKVMMNQRNIWFNGLTYERLDYSSDMGELFYDEANAMNEGIADFFSYYMTGRDSFGEWGIGRFFRAARPHTESDDLHISQVQNVGRLSYPQFLHYDNNFPNEIVEGIHNAGMITSHFLHRLTNEFKNQCSSLSSYSGASLHAKAGDYTVLVLSETLAEMGDLFGKKTDLASPTSSNFFTNFNDQVAYDWAQIVTPPTYRSFFRTMAKNIKANMTDGLCPEFSLDDLETLLDEYGLLLFKYYGVLGSGTDGTDYINYNELNGNSLVFGRTFTPSAEVLVNEANRKKSTLVSKEFIDLSEEGAIAFIFDGKSEIDSLLTNLTYEGKDVFPTSGIASTDYNNDNLKVSPGEIVGISLNLENTSNSTMAGIHILASDWDHTYVADTTKNGIEPCQYEDFPLVSEGGILSTNSAAEGDCEYTTRKAEPYQLNAGNYPKDPLAPVCLVESLENNETRWVSQGYFRKATLGLEDDECLNNSPADGTAFNPHECLVRFLPGANQAFFSKIDPQKTWAQTLQGDTGGTVFINNNGILLMEVNRLIQPGTTFACRMRVKFSNCSDCYNDEALSREYSDYEYAGYKPYKLINFRFTVID
jgi:hypothetical protein